MIIEVSNYSQAISLLHDTKTVKCADVSDMVLSTIVERAPMLEDIDLSGCEQITDESAVKLGAIGPLQVINLALCGLITDVSCKAFENLKELRFLSLGWCYQVSDVALGSISKCEKLETLLLWGCEKITDYGVLSIADLPKLARLELPELSTISDVGITTLAAKALPLRFLRLTSLDLLTDTGVLALRSLEELESLVISGCRNVTMDSVIALRVALPKCRVDYEP
jgi:F-box and leucine-rich repeat protein GRR1